MVDEGLGSIVGNFLPNSSTVFGIAFWVLIVIVIVLILGGITWFVLEKVRYKKIIKRYANVSGRSEFVGLDKARIMKLGNGGEIAWYWKNAKVVTPPGTIQISRNVYNYFETDDGERINFGYGNIDKKLREMNVNFTHPEMRYARSNIQRSFKDRYNKVTFLDKYGTILIFTVHIIIVSLMFVWILKDFKEVASALTVATQNSAELIKIASQIVNQTSSNIHSTGLIQVPINMTGV